MHVFLLVLEDYSGGVDDEFYLADFGGWGGGGECCGG